MNLTQITMIMMTLALCLSNITCVESPAKKQNVRKQAAARQIVLPVSVYRLQFERHSQLSAQNDYAEVIRLFKDVNAIWSKWGITWEVSSIDTIDVKPKEFSLPERGYNARWEFRMAAAALIPPPTGEPQWRVYLVKQFPVNGNGVYILEKSAVLYSELNQKGTRSPGILAHELGHSLGLSHVPLPGNLMYVGPVRTQPTEFELTPNQIRMALKQATVGPVYKKMDRLYDKMEERNKERRHRRALQKPTMFEMN